MSRKRIFDVIQIGNDKDLPSRLFDILIAVVIVCNILGTFLETFSELDFLRSVWKSVEAVTILVFIVEYILRVWTADFLYPNLSRGKATWKFVTSFDGIVELLIIIPAFTYTGLVAFRMLRVVRIFHLFRINAYYDSFHVIRNVLYEKKNQIASSLFIILILMLASSLCIYNLEHDAQPEAFKNAFSGLYWSISTMLTVGFGDITPITPMGQIMTMVIELLGVCLVAIPTGIISAGFVEQYSRIQPDLDKPQDGKNNLQVVVIDIDSGWIGKNTDELKEQNNIALVMVQRKNKKLVPDRRYRVQVGDALIVHAARDEQEEDPQEILMAYEEDE